MSQFPAPQQTGQYSPAAPAARPRSYITIVAILICVAIFFLFNAQQQQTYAVAWKFGFYRAEEIYGGAFWAVITSAFVHFDLFHVGFNMYWLWLLGSRVERAIGSGWYLLLMLASAIVSSSAQLAFSDTTGIGASGVVYAIFGFMLLTRRRYPEFLVILHGKTIQMFLIWLVACFAISYMGIWPIGNAAHLSGLIFGVLASLPVMAGMRALAAVPACAVLLATATLAWSPWSPTWLMVKAAEAEKNQEYALAIDYYSRVIEKNPNHVQALVRRAGVHRKMENNEAAEEDLTMAHQLTQQLQAN